MKLGKGKEINKQRTMKNDKVKMLVKMKYRYVSEREDM